MSQIDQLLREVQARRQAERLYAALMAGAYAKVTADLGNESLARAALAYSEAVGVLAPVRASQPAGNT